MCPEAPPRPAAPRLARPDFEALLADNLRSGAQLGFSILAYVANWAAILWLTPRAFVVAIPLLVLQALITVRLFNIQHDCAHRSYFTARVANDVVGGLMAFATLTSHAYWRRHHLSHHAASGNLDGRGDGDILMWTLEEYERADALGRLRYRLYRHPAVYLLVGPIYYFMVKMRLPWMARAGSAEWRSILLSDLLIAAPYVAMTLAGGPVLRLVGLHFAVSLVAGGTGLWLFFVQHQFEGTAWRREGEFDAREMALAGSSHVELGGFLQWMFVSINFHHVHHLHTRLPNYSLRQAMRLMGLEGHPATISLRQALGAFRLKLWDEAEGRLIPFPGAGR